MTTVTNPDPFAAGAPAAEPTAVKSYNRPRAIAAMIAVTNPGAFSMIAAPLLLSAFVRGGGMTAAQGSTLAAGELAGMTAASLAAALLVSRVDRRLLLVVGLAVALLGHVASALLPGFGAVLAARVIAGFGTGTMFTTGVAGLAGTSNPERAFGFSMTTNQAVTMLLMTIVARLGPQAGPVQTIAVIVVLSVLMGIAIPLVPARTPDQSGEEARGAASTGIFPPLLGLLALLSFSIAIGMVWPLVGQIGVQGGIAPALVDGTIALAGIGAIVGGLAAASIGSRFGRLPILIPCIVSLTAAMLFLHFPFSAGGFRAAMLAILFFWPVSIPFLLGTLAMLDPAGRWAALSGATLPCGMSLGGAIAATIVAGGDLPRVALTGSIAMIASAVLVASALWIANRAR